MQCVDEKVENQKKAREEEEEKDRQEMLLNVPISFLMQKIAACFAA